jgi:hypothetical protein
MSMPLCDLSPGRASPQLLMNQLVPRTGHTRSGPIPLAARRKESSAVANRSQSGASPCASQASSGSSSAPRINSAMVTASASNGSDCTTTIASQLSDASRVRSASYNNVPMNTVRRA